MSIDAGSLLADIRRNRAAIESCPRHRFPAKGPTYRLGDRVTCERCGGTMDLRAVGDYLRGYAAAGGDPREVMPDWPPTSEPIAAGHADATAALCHNPIRQDDEE